MATNEGLARLLSSAIERAVGDVLDSRRNVQTTNEPINSNSDSSSQSTSTNVLNTNQTSSEHNNSRDDDDHHAQHRWVHLLLSKFRPKKTIPENRLKRLLELKMPLAQIARDLGVSRPVLYKFIRENGISHEKYSTLSEQEVQNVVAEVKKNHPNAGEVMLQGHLQSKGITLQHHKIRTAIHAVDPDGVEARKRPTIKRRVYSVPYPNYLWHIDGNHKLIRWRIVVHHGIDGYSRMVVFAQFSTNNRAITVEDLFKAAIQQYGCPVRVRTDYGGENVGVWRHMVNVHGEDSRAVIDSWKLRS
ncbi:hypothetical protein AC249_AIPGENE24350 [Paramuricea clavata]|uniref:Uncharacterized protein n=1 Tax=Paramuricea clavata TaxID=317549 RepID=A0A6S7FDS0_PARCT|nr:hypothetical protein AC249_AIPGENE24350 [Paramuricea clavata]